MTTAVRVDLDALMTDPFPHFAAMRAAPGWTWSDVMGMWLVTRYDDVVLVDSQPELFSTEIPGALLTRTLGPTMIRSEGATHRRLRSAADPPLRRRSVHTTWAATIERLARGHVEALRDLLRERDGADLMADLAAPLTGAVLREVLGLPDATPADIGRWSDAFIGGLTNNRDDPEVWAAAADAAQEAQAAVTSAMARTRRDPDAAGDSVVAAMAQAHPDRPLSTEEVASNVRLMIAGGYNDARDAVATLAWLLMTHPDAAARAQADPVVFERAIDESVRWLSPVGTYPRIVTRDVECAGVRMRRGDRVLVVAASANHDETRFADPARFDVDRPNLAEHLGFSIGVHYCMGSHLVRALLRAAVPGVLSLPGIRPAGDPRFVGWQFRGPVSVPVRLDGTGSTSSTDGTAGAGGAR